MSTYDPYSSGQQEPPPGWWLASDGRYYPPEQAPGQTPPPAPPGPPGNYGGGGYYSGGYPVYAQPQTTNGMAIASLVLGILWLYWGGSILALVFGYVARGQIKRSNGAQNGGGMAVAGIVLGWIGVAAAALVAVIVIIGIATTDGYNTDPSDGYCDDSRFFSDPDC